MGFHHLDEFAGRHSWLARRTSSEQRLWIAIAAAFAAGLMPPGAWRALGVLALIIAAGAWAAALPVPVLARRVAAALPFFLLPALALPLTVPGPTAVSLGALRLSEPGILRALEIVARATLAVSAVTVVISTTRAADLLGALDSLPLPHVVRSSLAMGYRYAYVLNDERERGGRALASRAGRAPRLRIWRARAATLAHLLARAHARGTRIHAAMLSRGYTEAFPTLRTHEHGSAAWTLAVVAVLMIVWLGGLVEMMT
jgi:cobalt/nickel transport system permease protein